MKVLIFIQITNTSHRAESTKPTDEITSARTLLCHCERSAVNKIFYLNFGKIKFCVTFENQSMKKLTTYYFAYFYYHGKSGENMQ